jgi:pyrroline-5-carboxylate reductase
MSPLTIGFCGGGVMSRALIQGILNQQTNNKPKLLVYDPLPESLQQTIQAGAKSVPSNASLIQDYNADIIFLCTKPQYIVSVCTELRSANLNVKKTLIVSIAAGVSCATIESALPPSSRVIRVMPNTPCVVSRMAAGLCCGLHATQQDANQVLSLMNPLGCIVQVANEDQMHAVTGLSGSGPAYIFITIEALADGGVRAGLPRDIALKLAIHTVRGAAEMCFVNGNTHPAVLKDQVASPGGTTIAAIAALEKNGVRNAFIEAVTAGSARSRELSKL